MNRIEKIQFTISGSMSASSGGGERNQSIGDILKGKKASEFVHASLRIIPGRPERSFPKSEFHRRRAKQW